MKILDGTMLQMCDMVANQAEDPQPKSQAPCNYDDQVLQEPRKINRLDDFAQEGD